MQPKQFICIGLRVNYKTSRHHSIPLVVAAKRRKDKRNFRQQDDGLQIKKLFSRNNIEYNRIFQGFADYYFAYRLTLLSNTHGSVS